MGRVLGGGHGCAAVQDAGEVERPGAERRVHRQAVDVGHDDHGEVRVGYEHQVGEVVRGRAGVPHDAGADAVQGAVLPAEAVGAVTGVHGPGVQLSRALRAEDPGVAVAAAAQLRDRVVGQVVEAGGEEAVGHSGGVEGRGEALRPAEVVTVPGRDADGAGLVGGGRGAGHPERVEHGAAQVAAEGVAGDALDERAEDHVVGVAVFVGLPGGGDGPQGGQVTHGSGQSAGAVVVAVGQAGAPDLRQATGVGQ